MRWQRQIAHPAAAFLALLALAGCGGQDEFRAAVPTLDLATLDLTPGLSDGADALLPGPSATDTAAAALSEADELSQQDELHDPLANAAGSAATPAACVSGDDRPTLIAHAHRLSLGVNRSLRMIRRATDLLLRAPPHSATKNERVWSRTTGGLTRRLTVTRVSAGLFQSRLDLLPAHGSAWLLVYESVSRTGPRASGTISIDLTALHGATPSEHAIGKLRILYGAGSSAEAPRKQVAVDFTGFNARGAAPGLTGRAMFRGDGKRGGTLLVHDDARLGCTAGDPGGIALVYRWTEAAGGRSEARADGVTPGPSKSGPRTVAVDCSRRASTGAPPLTYWLLKGEDAARGTIDGTFRSSPRPSTADACAASFGPLPRAGDAGADFDFQAVDFDGDAAQVAG